MRNALLLCVYGGDEVLIKELLQRNQADWFPYIPYNMAHWSALGRKEPLTGKTPEELKKQSEMLIFTLV